MADGEASSPLLGVQRKDKGKPLGLLSSVAYIIAVFGVPPIVALPAALEYCGALGFLIVPFLILVETYTAVLLGKSWILLEKNWPSDANQDSKSPYCALAQRVGGPVFRRTVRFILNLAIFGEAVPFLLLASENLLNIINDLMSPKAEFSFCYILILTALFITPFIWIGTPKELRFITWIGAASVVIMCALVLSLLVLEAPTGSFNIRTFPETWASVAYCFGAVAFQFGAHSVVLTIQMDMADKQQLITAIIIAFSIAFSLYGLIAIVAFFLYGDLLQANLLNNFPDSPLLYVAQGVVAVQSLICLVLGINASFQDLEENIGIPDMFGWRRVCLRTALMLLVLFVAESIPHFAVALELVGGLLTTQIIFIFPPLFYIGIKYKAHCELTALEIFLGVEIVFIGVLGCIAASIESGIQISQLKSFAPPCYIDNDVASS